MVTITIPRSREDILYHWKGQAYRTPAEVQMLVDRLIREGRVDYAVKVYREVSLVDFRFPTKVTSCLITQAIERERAARRTNGTAPEKP